MGAGVLLLRIVEVLTVQHAAQSVWLVRLFGWLVWRLQVQILGREQQ